MITSNTPLISAVPTATAHSLRQIIRDKITAETKLPESQRIPAGPLPITQFLALVPEKTEFIINLFSGLSSSEFMTLSICTRAFAANCNSDYLTGQELRDIITAQDDSNLAFLLINTVKGADHILHGRVMDELSRNPQIKTLHAMTFNIWGIPGFIGGKDFWRFPLIADSIVNSPKDIICLQEVFHPQAKKSLRDSADRAGLYISSAEPHNFFGIIGSNGLHTISRLPTLNCEFVPFKAALGFQRLVRKGFLHTEHRLSSGETLRVFNLHMQSTIRRTPLEAVRTVRLKQMQQLAEYAATVARVDDVVLYMGDFNISASDPESAQIGQILAGDSWDNSNTPNLNLCPPQDDPQAFFSGDTYNPLLNPYARDMKISNIRKSPERIDRILLRDPRARKNAVMMTAADFRSAQGPLSDHESLSILRTTFR